MNDETAGYTPTTTHAEWGAGDPHLRVTGPDEERSVVHLTDDAVTIGSAAGSTVLVPGADPLHATITHDERDEYVLTMHGEGEMNASREESADRSEVLRTGAHFTVGQHLFVFGREEFADHGRPYGGRQGGELSDQDSQPQRPDYTGHGDHTEHGDARQHEVRDA